MENTCKTCINNDDGLCDRKGIIVEDEDFCEHHWAAGKKIRMKRHGVIILSAGMGLKMTLLCSQNMP